MLDSETKRRIDTARDILVGKVPDPKSQVEQITIALIYKFMDDMDAEAEEMGGERRFFTDDFAKYGWSKLMGLGMGGHETLNLYGEAITRMTENSELPPLFRDIFKNAYLPYRDPETLKSFLKIIDDFEYDHSERLGDAFEYLLSVLGSQGAAGQFRTPRHIIDFMAEIIDPQKDEIILDPACGTAGFLISAYKHILKHNSSDFQADKDREAFDEKGVPVESLTLDSPMHYKGDLLTPDERRRLTANIKGYDISPDMVRLSLVNMYLHGFADPHIHEYDTLTSDDKWNEYADVILANPPFMSPKGGIRPHKRFSIQAKRSEVLFVDYMAEHLTPNGRAAIVVPEGIIFQSGTAYKSLREMLVNNYLVAVVSLPAGVFNPYSGVKTSILILDRQKVKQRDSVLFVKIENDGFNLGAQRRPIDKNDLPEALRLIKGWLADPEDFEISPMAHAVERKRIGEKGEWNLSGERYLSQGLQATDHAMVALGDVVEILDRQRKPITKHNRVPGPYPYYGATGVLDYVNDYLFDEPLVLVGEDGAKWESGEKTAYAISGKTWVNNHAHALRPKRNMLLDTYLIEMLNEMDLSPYITGVTVPKLNQEKLRSIQIPLPPIEVQKEIVAEIEGYQKIIDGARLVVKNYHPRIPIDPDWPMVEVEKVCDLIGGGTPSKSNAAYWDRGSIKWISSKHISNQGKIIGFELITEKAVKESSTKIAPRDSTILITRVSVGKCAYANNDYAINQDLTALVTKDSSVLNPGFLFLAAAMVAKIVEENAQGIGVRGVTRNFLAKIQIPLPSLETQKEIASKINEEKRLVDANKELISIFEEKIRQTINRVWGENEGGGSQT